MSRRGVHFALTDEQASRLMDTPGADNDFLMAFVEEGEEGPNGEGWDAEWVQETDKSWDAIHRCLTDGKLEWGDSPFHKCILGSDNLYKGRDYIMNFLSPEEVKQVAAWQDQFLRFMREQKKGVWDQLAKEKKISKDLEAAIRKAVEEFQPQFKA